MPSSSRVVTSEQSSKNYEVFNTDDNISAWFLQPTRLLQLIIFFKVFSHVAIKEFGESSLLWLLERVQYTSYFSEMYQFVIIYSFHCHRGWILQLLSDNNTKRLSVTITFYLFDFNKQNLSETWRESRIISTSHRLNVWIKSFKNVFIMD